MIVALLMLAPAPALGNDRVVETLYVADHIVRLAGVPLIQTMIEFAADERIENIALGDSAAWQITPNKRANLIFAKPLIADARTNMTVITDKRRYLFELTTGGRGARPVYVLRFTYPMPERVEIVAQQPAPVAAAAAAPLPINTNWQVSGDRRLAPARIYDDSVSTFIAWSASEELPAILVPEPDKSEGPVNFIVRGDYLVIDGVAPRYILRRGQANATLTNLSLAAPRSVAEMAGVPQ